MWEVTLQQRRRRGDGGIGLEESIWYCALDEAGELLPEQRLGYDTESHERGVRRNAAEPDRVRRMQS